MKKKGEDEEIQSDEEEGTSPGLELSSEDKTGATDFSDLGEVSEEAEGVAKSEGKESPAEALKKKKSLIIKVVIGVALVALILHESPEDEQPVEGEAPKVERPKRNMPAPPAEAAATPPATETPVAAEATPTEVETAPVQGPAVEEPVKEASAPVAEKPIDEAPAVTETLGSEEISLDLDPAETSPVIEATGTSEKSNDTIDENVAESTGEDNLTDKILQDLEKEAKKSEVKNDRKDYVAPPDYEYVGRGLVYNCTGKHWACVDGPSYKSCENNAASIKYLKKTAECYPFNVYQSQKGCENMQNRMVSSSAKTAFCSE